MFRQVTLQQYTVNRLKETLTELFIANRTGIDNPHVRPVQGGHKTFCVLEHGECEGDFGCWVEDDETAECGFLPDHDDTFWAFDDEAEAWIARRFKGRSLRKGKPKGRGKGKGSKGRKQFRPRKQKGKGRAHIAEDDEWDEPEDADETAALSKGKGKGKSKKGKGKGKPKGEQPETFEANKGGKKGMSKGKKGKRSGKAHVAEDSWEDTWDESQWPAEDQHPETWTEETAAYSSSVWGQGSDEAWPTDNRVYFVHGVEEGAEETHTAWKASTFHLPVGGSERGK